MAGTAVTAQSEFSTSPAGEVEALRQTVNKLVDDVEAVRAALVAHGAVAHTTVALAAATLTGNKVNLR